MEHYKNKASAYMCAPRSYSENWYTYRSVYTTLLTGPVNTTYINTRGDVHTKYT